MGEAWNRIRIGHWESVDREVEQRRARQREKDARKVKLAAETAAARILDQAAGELAATEADAILAAARLTAAATQARAEEVARVAAEMHAQADRLEARSPGARLSITPRRE